MNQNLRSPKKQLFFSLGFYTCPEGVPFDLERFLCFLDVHYDSDWLQCQHTEGSKPIKAPDPRAARQIFAALLIFEGFAALLVLKGLAKF